MSDQERCCNWICWKIVFASIGITLGIAAGFAFGPVLSNYDASVFAFFSGLIAGLTLLVHILYRRGFWNYAQQASLHRLMYTGCFVQLIGVTSFVVYIVMGSLYQTDKLHIQGRSYFLTCVWCFMTWKWGFLLFFYARNYRREINKMETIQVFD